MHFRGNESLINDTGIPFTLVDYIELVDWTGRIARENKCGHIAKSLPPILQRLKLGKKQWLTELEKCHLQKTLPQQVKYFLHGQFEHISRRVVQVVGQRQPQPPNAASPIAV